LTSIDYEGDINRIIAILKNDSGLFPAVTIGDGKLRDVIFGEDSHKIHDGSFPYCLVTTPDRPFFTKDSLGIGDGSSDPQHSVQYLIRVFSKEGRPQVAEKNLYGFIKKVTDILKANPRLKEPVAVNDPKCIRSFVDIPLLGERGEEIQSVEVTLTCQIGSEFTLDIAGFTAIPLISKPIERETEITENIKNTANIRKAVSPVSEVHSFLAEMEYVEAQVSTFRTQKRNRAVISITLTRPSGTTVYSGKLIEISNGASYDQLEIVTVLFEVIH